jgi:ABC-type polysaccharide/polyol phosphate export permease
VFLRDLGYTVALVTQVLFFVTPIFYPIEAIPPSFRSVARYNPWPAALTPFGASSSPGRSTTRPRYWCPEEWVR